jgi:hypothetical protein
MATRLHEDKNQTKKTYEQTRKMCYLQWLGAGIA